MRKQRHYRGGYDFTGLLKLGRELRKHETRVETFCGNCFAIASCSGSSSDVSTKLDDTLLTFIAVKRNW